MVFIGERLKLLSEFSSSSLGQMMFLRFGFLLLIVASCSPTRFVEKKIEPSRTFAAVENDYENELRSVALEKGQTLEFPPGVNAHEQKRMWHLTEGSDIYPTLWLLNLKSFLSPEKGTLFFENLDKKFAVIRSPYSENVHSPYAWVGLTAVWDGEKYEEQDLINDASINFKELPRTKKLANGQETIAMTGANCAFCHTGSVLRSDQTAAIIDGAPSQVEMKGFFYDIIGSTYQTMFDKKEMIAFYNRLNVQNADQKASQFVDDLKKELDVEDTLFTAAIKVLIKTPGLGKKINESVNVKAGRLLYEKKDVLTKYLVRMLKETFDLKTVTPLMQKRMEYLTWFGAPNPDVVSTPEGHGRTDAFGRISNATIRKKSYTHITAPVSLPPMYAMKYKAFYHYNANTNSLVARNVGQAFGLGAIVLNDQYASTVNIPNLIELEKIIHKVPVPEYTQIFPDKKIDRELVKRGCNVYLNKCVQCHEADDERVGPQKLLINHKMIDMEIIDTDRQYVKNISKSALGLPFKTAIFNFTDSVKEGFYSTNNVSSDLQKIYAQESIRGKEIFRDSFLGEDRFKGDPTLDYTTLKPGTAYVARHLAGVWSTAPYLHNGSVPNLEELLKPAALRVKKFKVGTNVYDHQKLGFESALKEKECSDDNDPACLNTALVGNSNRGHEPSMYGGELKASDKKALVEFLKVLTPELETAWTSLPLYKIQNNKCELR